MLNKNIYINEYHATGKPTTEFRQTYTDCDELIGILIKLVDSLQGNKTNSKDWLYYASILTNKFIYHSISLLSLFKGVKPQHFSTNSIELIDISSIYILLRTIIENYLTFYYLYVQPESKTEIEFKFNLYKLSGLIRRQKLIPRSLGTIEKKEKESKEIEIILQEIKNNLYFLSLNEKRQNSIIKNPQPRLYSWNNIMNSSEINNDIIIHLWSMCSNYAHSEYWSLIQIKDFSKESNNFILEMSITVFIMLVSIMINDFNKVFTDEGYNLIPLQDNELAFINYFNSIAKNKNVNY